VTCSFKCACYDWLLKRNLMLNHVCFQRYKTGRPVPAPHSVWNIDGIQDLIPRSLYTWRATTLRTGHWSVGTAASCIQYLVHGYDPLTSPGHIRNTTEAMSAAGSFYTGTNVINTCVQNGTRSTLHVYTTIFFLLTGQDNKKCFHCGGGLRNWLDTDDPWRGHVAWLPNCVYIHYIPRGVVPYIKQNRTGVVPHPKQNGTGWSFTLMWQ
jgi:hypothetical protein